MLSGRGTLDCEQDLLARVQGLRLVEYLVSGMPRTCKPSTVERPMLIAATALAYGRECH